MLAKDAIFGTLLNKHRLCSWFDQLENMMTQKKTVEFDAHKTVKKPAEVKFTTKKGQKVDFVAKKNVKEPVHVKFKAKK